MFGIYPTVSGILAMDSNGYICDSDNKIVTSYATEDVRSLDSAVLYQFIRERSQSELFVVGKNTLQGMGNIRDKLIPYGSLIISDESGFEFMRERVEYHNESHPRIQLLNGVFRIAIRNRMDICVLGGRSVYMAFADHYSSLTVCELKDVNLPNGKQLRIVPDGPCVHEAFDEKSLCPTPYMNKTVPIDNETYRITEYRVGV